MKAVCPTCEHDKFHTLLCSANDRVCKKCETKTSHWEWKVAGKKREERNMKKYEKI